MRVRELGTRPVPASIRSFLRLGRGHAPAVLIERRQVPYFQERGWTRSGNVYTGSYQTQHASFLGRIEERRGGLLDFFLYQPSDHIRKHSHFVCFQGRGGGWYLIHMGRKPKDVSSGILIIERLISEAYST